MRAAPTVPAARLGLFTVVEALAAGWTPDSLARAVRRGDLRRWRRGVYSPAWQASSEIAPYRRDRIDLARAAIAGALTCDAAVASHLATAVCFGWPVWAPRPRSCVVVDDNRSRVPGLHVHRTPLRVDANEEAGFRFTRPTRTVLDIACEFGPEAGLVVADAALARGHTTVERLDRAVAAGYGRTGIASARSMVDLVDSRSESPLESRSRWQCVVHDLPRPEPQVVLLGLEGEVLGRVDLYWDVGVVGEVDGLGKLADAGARRAFSERHGRLSRAGLRLVRWGELELRSFGPTAAWLREELAAAAADPRPRRWHAVPTSAGS